MTTFDRQIPGASDPDLSRAIDRLVDGELSDEEQVRLLRRLDAEPRGWRRLALAYVEAQAWGRDFRQTLAPADRPMSVVCPLPPPGSRARTGNSRWLLAAVCVSCLSVGFWLSLPFFRGGMSSTARDQPGDFQESVAKAVKSVPKMTADDPAGIQGSPTMVRVRSASQGGESQEVDVPLIRASQVNPDWLHSRGTLSPKVRRDLRNAGHDVEEFRRLIPFELEDGRWGVIPVDEVRFVNRRGVQ